MRTLAPIILIALAACGAPRALAQTPTGADSVSVTSVDNDTESSVSVVQTLPSRSRDSSSSGHGDESLTPNAAPAYRVLSYSRILKQVQTAAPGDVVKVRLMMRQGGLWTYECEVLDSAGRLTRVSLDARTAAVISKKRL